MTEEFRDLIKKGLVPDIFKMERAYHLHKVIGDNADTLNEYANGNFGELFGTVQAAMESEAVLAVARVYDTPRRHPTRCIRRALELMEHNSEQLPEIVDAYNAQLDLEKFGASAEIVQSASLGKAKFIPLCVPYIRQILDSEEVRSKVMRLKDLRDKCYAHNDLASFSGPTWDELNELIVQAQQFVSVIGSAFFSTAYTIDNSYSLSSDAQKPSRALNRLATLLSQGDYQ
jgi:hypothetical protein